MDLKYGLKSPKWLLDHLDYLVRKFLAKFGSYMSITYKLKGRQNLRHFQIQSDFCIKIGKNVFFFLL